MFDVVSILIWLSLVARNFHDLVMIASILHNPILPLNFKQKWCYAYELTGKNCFKKTPEFELTNYFYFSVTSLIQTILCIVMTCEYKELHESQLDEFQKFGIIFLVINSAVTYFKILRKIDPYLI